MNRKMDAVEGIASPTSDVIEEGAGKVEGDVPMQGKRFRYLY